MTEIDGGNRDQRTQALKESLVAYQNRARLLELERRTVATRRMQTTISQFPLMNGINDIALDILTEPATDPLNLASSLFDKMVDVSTISIPVPEDQLNTRLIMSEDTNKDPSPAAVIRVGKEVTSMVYFYQGMAPEKAGSTNVPAVVLDVKEGSMFGYDTAYTRIPRNDGTITLIQNRNLTPPKLIELWAPDIETKLARFLGKNYETALALVKP